MQWALIDGEEETGVTTMYMDTGLDTGDMLLKASIKLSEDDNFLSLLFFPTLMWWYSPFSP